MDFVREKPGDEEWERLHQMKIPLLLNYSQCQILQGHFYQAIEHCTTVLEKDPGMSLDLSNITNHLFVQHMYSTMKDMLHHILK